MLTRTIVVLVAALLLASAPGRAQTLSGTIAGTVTDEQGQVLPGATVVLTGRTGSTSQVTDGSGEFRFIGLQPGVYAIRAELSGFRPFERQGLDVAIGATVQLKVTL